MNNDFKYYEVHFEDMNTFLNENFAQLHNKRFVIYIPVRQKFVAEEPYTDFVRSDCSMSDCFYIERHLGFIRFVDLVKSILEKEDKDYVCSFKVFEG